MGRRAAIVRLRVAARRPATWLSLAAAAGAVWWLVAERGAWWPAAGIAPATVAATIALCAAGVGLLHAVAPAALQRGVRSASGDSLPRAVMMSALVAMVICLFLAPHLAWGYAALAAAWLLASAVPRAALGAGMAGDAARRLLVATCAGPRARPTRAAARLVAAYAAVLVWPPLVAAVLADSPAAAREPVMIAVAIAAGAAGLAGLIAGVLAVGGSREITLALALCLAVAGAATASAVVSWDDAGPTAAESRGNLGGLLKIRSSPDGPPSRGLVISTQFGLPR